MQLLKTVAEVRRARAALSGSVGLVPTMGYLHDGHLSLVKAALAANDHVFASIFVNPTQFSPTEDFAAYPRDTDRDLALLEAAGVDYAFTPEPSEVYPEGFQTYVEVGNVAQVLEGAVRPGHFRGVATVVLKLFNVVQPDRAYFGRKDAQQIVVIRTMVRDLNVPVEIVPMPTVREADGLAMSSRNAYLDPGQRKAAVVLHEALSLAQQMWTKGAREAVAYRTRLRELIESETGASIDYISLANPETLQEVERVHGRVLVSLAVRFGRTRLIDNVTLGEV